MSTLANLSPDAQEAWGQYQELQELVKKYLEYGSCDGRIERKELRKQLADLIGEAYDEKNFCLTKG